MVNCGIFVLHRKAQHSRRNSNRYIHLGRRRVGVEANRGTRAQTSSASKLVHLAQEPQYQGKRKHYRGSPLTTSIANHLPQAPLASEEDANNTYTSCKSFSNNRANMTCGNWFTTTAATTEQHDSRTELCCWYHLSGKRTVLSPRRSPSMMDR